MPTDQKLSPYDIPIICLVTGAVLALAATFFIVSAKHDLIPKEQLTPLSGTISRIHHTRTRRGDYLDIDLIASDGKHHLTQDDISDIFPTLNTLQPDDKIDARVRRGLLGERYWEIKRDGIPVLSYDETNQFFVDGQKRTAPLAQMLMHIALAFLAGAIILRICLGRWTGNKHPASVDQFASPTD